MGIVDLYGVLESSPVRAVMLTAKHLGVPINLKHMIWGTKEIVSPEFVKMNPQKTVPLLDDSGLYINESRAAIQYLANKYSTSETLYPKVPNDRALVDMRLYFDMGTLYARFAEAYYPAAFGDQPINSEKLQRLDDALGYLEVYLKDGYVAGGHLTIADFSVIASLATIDCFKHDLSRFPRVTEYFARCKKEINGYQEINQKGADGFYEMCKPGLDKAKRI